ncbi:MAG: hypothetical protein RBU29_17590, partial [bacterium]|nr:hypothetical protein [bacterium]
MNQWETLYQQAYRRGLQKIADLKGVACAFHSVIDGILRITPAILDTLFANQPHLKVAAKRGAQGEIPQEILSPDDFICGLFYSLSRGAACQRMIRAEATYQ